MELTMSQIHVKRAVERIGSIKAAASSLGVHYSMVNAILNGRKSPGPIICEKLGIPHSGDRRGGRRDRGALPQEMRRKPSRPEPPPDSPVEGETDEQGRARRAAEIRGERMPKPPAMVVKTPTWEEVVRSHLRLERRLGMGRSC